MDFANIIGNENAKDILLKSLKNKTILHSYMFIGNEGIGKRLLGIQFAKMILCENFNNNNLRECNTCKSCVEFNGNNNPDFKYIESEGNTIKIEQIREMQNKVIEKPIISEKKVYVINDADLMTREAQNCLLKTLEEPPEYVTIILIVSNENKILPTIKSRCMKIQFKNIDEEDIRKYLAEIVGNDNMNNRILKLCDGSIGKCLKIKEKIEDLKLIDALMENINESAITFLNSADILYKNKENIYDYLDYINVILYEKVHSNVYQNVRYINSIDIVEQTKQHLMNNGNYDMNIDSMLFGIWEEINEKYSRS